MFASAKRKKQKQVRQLQCQKQCIDHISYYLSGLSRAHFFRQPFSKQLYNGQFHLSLRKATIFSILLPRLIRTAVNMDTGSTFSCVPSHKLPCIINPTLRTLFICALFMNEYFNSENQRFPSEKFVSPRRDEIGAARAAEIEFSSE